MRMTLIRRPVLALALLTTIAQAAPVTLNLKDADINALIASIAEITGKNFIVDPRVQGRVTVVSSRPLEEDEVYEVFLSILAVHGYAAIPGDSAVKIVPAAGAKQEQIPNLGGTAPDTAIGGEDQMVTQVIQVRNVAAAQLVPLLRPLIPPDGHLAAYAPSNVLVVSDRAGNVRRIAELIGRMDRASDAEIERIPLHYAQATELTGLLQGLVAGRQTEGGGATPQLAADPRSNSILLSGDTETRRRLRDLIGQLDTPLPAAGNTQVVYLKYARAEELLSVLEGLSRKLETEAGDSASAAPGEARIDIQADPTTNALVITAGPDAMRSLETVIDQLDIRRAQVMVEAAIVEIASDKVAELGVQWLLDGSSDGSVVGLTNFESASFNGLSVGELARAIASETIPNPFPSGLSAALGDFEGSTRFGALISALASDADTNILSTPTLVTLDNEEAEIVVGQNVPFVTGTFTTTTGGSGDVGNPFQTIERRDVGLTLRIRPQINEGDAVQLEISQEVSSVAQSATALALAQGPTTNKRSLKTNVLVQDNQILVLGGLIDDNLSETVQKVPGLGDLPVIGNLFRYRQTSKGKRNLMVFLHPVILRDAASGSEQTRARYQQSRRAQRKAREQGVELLPDAETPLLPDEPEVQARGTLIPEPQDTPPPAAAPAAPATPGLGGFNSK